MFFVEGIGGDQSLRESILIPTYRQARSLCFLLVASSHLPVVCTIFLYESVLRNISPGYSGLEGFLPLRSSKNIILN